MKQTLEGYEQAIGDILGEMADMVDLDETPENVARRADLEAQLADLIDREADKVDRVAAVLRRFAAAADECGRESQRLRERGKAFDSKRERLAGYVIDVMVRSDLKRLEGTHSTLTRIQNPGTIEVEDANALPFEFQRWAFCFRPKNRAQLEFLQSLRAEFADGVVECMPDKLAMKKWLGESSEAVIAGAQLKPGTFRLAVR